MKLLDKKTIQVQKSIERKSEIDEGMKLAKSIDSLRDNYSKEQVNLRKFRDQTLGSIKAEIEVLILNKSALINDLALLKKEKELAQIPLDFKWKELDKKALLLQDWDTDLLLKDEQLKIRDEKLRGLSERSQIENEKLKIKENWTNNLLNEAKNLNYQANKLKKEADQYKITVLEELKIRSSTISSKEEELKYKEVDLINRKQKIENDKKEIINKEILLRDREQTLERELLRQQKNGRIISK